MKNYYIYKITNLINNKIYVGQRGCEKPCERDRYMGSGLLLLKALKKYGRENFKKELIEYVTLETIDEREIFWIKHFDAMNPEIGYNLCEGGLGSRGCVVTEETRQKLREINLGKTQTEESKERRREYYLTHPHTEENLKKMREVNLGKTLTEEQRERRLKYRLENPTTEETKKKISEALKGKKVSDETKQKLREINLGKTASAETREKLSKIHKGRIVSEEAKKKTADAHRGKKLSIEHKKKLSEAHKGLTNSAETRRKISEGNKGRVYPIVTCPHCGKEGGLTGMKNWHFDNCKQNPNKL